VTTAPGSVLAAFIFTAWDKIMRTEDPIYYDTFRRAVSQCALRARRSAN
jgi:hypothetical protein